MIWKKAYNSTRVKVTPQVLREWFCDEMGRLGVPDRYVEAYIKNFLKQSSILHSQRKSLFSEIVRR